VTRRPRLRYDERLLLRSARAKRRRAWLVHRWVPAALSCSDSYNVFFATARPGDAVWCCGRGAPSVAQQAGCACCKEVCELSYRQQYLHRFIFELAG